MIFMAENGGEMGHCLVVDGLVGWLASAFRENFYSKKTFAQIDENQTHNLGRALLGHVSLVIKRNPKHNHLLGRLTKSIN